MTDEIRHVPAIADDASDAEVAAVLDDIADVCEGEPNNDAWNFRAVARRVQRLSRERTELLEAARYAADLMGMLTAKGSLDKLAADVHPDRINRMCDMIDRAIAKATDPNAASR